jgi:hypothetical protein
MTVILKARQLGLSWLVLAYALWLMLFHPAVTVLLFSKRDDEAVELLDFRLKGMHDRLPTWLQADSYTNGKHQWLMANGSRAMAFPTTGGRSYTATLAIVDEADFVPDLAELMNAVKPTIDAGGKMVLLSTSDKSQPQSLFKKIYQAAVKGLNEFRAVFLSWRSRPSRTEEWYEAQKQATIAQTGALDALHQEYPDSDVQALAPNSLDKRLPQEWLLNCYKEGVAIKDHGGPALPGLFVYKLPSLDRAHEYVIGADPAEGNPTSDDSSASVVDKLTGEEVALLCAKYEPSVFGSYIRDLSLWYNKADVLPERNNHGHALIQWLHDNAQGVRILRGTDSKLGWLTTSASKAVMYSNAADMFRQGDTAIHNQGVYLQLSSIEGATLSAPKLEMDDKATGFVLALLARSRDRVGSVSEEAQEIIDEWG